MNVEESETCMKIRRVFESLSKELPLTEREFCLKFHGMVDGWDLLRPAMARITKEEDVFAGEHIIGRIEVLEGEVGVVCSDVNEVYSVSVVMEALHLHDSLTPIIMRLEVRDVKLVQKISGEYEYFGLYEDGSDLFCSPYVEWEL
jgi:hypothetical protein